MCVWQKICDIFHWKKRLQFFLPTETISERCSEDTYIFRFFEWVFFQRTGWRGEAEKWWASLSDGQRVFAPICFINVLVFLGWRIPALKSTMLRYFCSSPSSSKPIDKWTFSFESVFCFVFFLVITYWYADDDFNSFPSRCDMLANAIVDVLTLLRTPLGCEYVRAAQLQYSGCSESR